MKFKEGDIIHWIGDGYEHRIAEVVCVYNDRMMVSVLNRMENIPLPKRIYLLDYMYPAIHHYSDPNELLKNLL